MVSRLGPKASRQPRRASYIIARYNVREGTFRDIIKNISAGGLFIRTSRKIATGQSITLEFPLFNFEEDIDVKGTVIRVEHHGFAVEFDRPLRELMDTDSLAPALVHEGDRRS
jgi:hypothetical protein